MADGIAQATIQASEIKTFHLFDASIFTDGFDEGTLIHWD
jgi:hypothetical protein